MENLTANINTTLAEELRLLEELIDTGAQATEAIAERSLDKLKQLDSAYQNHLLKLQIVRQTQGRLMRALASRIGPSIAGKGLKGMLEHVGAQTELIQLGLVQRAIARLQEINTRNKTLLDKKLASLRAFSQVVDLAGGAERIYDQIGDVRRLDQAGRIEEMR